LNLTTEMLKGLLYQTVCAYVDDILMFTKGSFEQHVADVEEVLKRIEEHEVIVKASKCDFFQKELRFMGMMVSGAGTRIDPKAMRAIEALQPNNVKTLQSFLGVCNFWRKWIDHFAEKADCLRPLLKPGGFKQGMTAEQQEAIKQLKAGIVGSGLIAHPDWNIPFQLHCDASYQGLGCMLAQEINGELRPIRFLSRGLISAEKSYSTTKLEMLCCVWATESLSQYRAGKRHIIPDALSRQPCQNRDFTRKTLRRAGGTTLTRRVYVPMQWRESILGPSMPCVPNEKAT